MSTALESTEPPAMVDAQAEQPLQKVATSIAQLTGIDTGIKDIRPVADKHPLDEAIQAELKQVENNQPSDDFEDLMKGLQGKIRTGESSDVLNEKMKYIAAKSGSEVELVDKKK